MLLGALKDVLEELGEVLEEVRDNRITKARLKIEPAAAEEDGERSGKKKRRESEDAAEEE